MERTKSQNGRRSRSKGAAFERWVVNELKRKGLEAERNIAQVRTAKREGCDVEGTGWFIECKVGANPDVKAAMEQARSDRGGDMRPIVVIWKKDRMEPMATFRGGTARGQLVCTVRFDAWLSLLAAEVFPPLWVVLT